MKKLCKRIDFEQLLQCGFGLTKNESQYFLKFIKANKRITVEQFAKLINKDRSIAQRSLSKFVTKDIIQRQQVNMSPNGYKYLYSVASKPKLKKMLLDNIELFTNDLKTELNRLL